MTTKAKDNILFTVRRPRNIRKALAEIAAAMVLGFLFFVAVIQETPYDDTDWPEVGLRSGLTLHIDYGTGCHWLRQGWSGKLVPRLNIIGKQVCLATDFRVPRLSTISPPPESSTDQPPDSA